MNAPRRRTPQRRAPKAVYLTPQEQQQWDDVMNEARNRHVKGGMPPIPTDLIDGLPKKHPYRRIWDYWRNLIKGEIGR